MKLNNIKLGSSYVFKLGSASQKGLPTDSGNIPAGFYQKYPAWGDVDGRTVSIISKHATGVKFFVLGDKTSEWAVAKPEFFFPLEKPLMRTSGCSCNLWVSGCNCGVFQSEQQQTPPKKRTWRYINSQNNLEEDPF
jgi:hypothetical protein